jgi:hypothetical protein
VVVHGFLNSLVFGQVDWPLFKAPTRRHYLAKAEFQAVARIVGDPLIVSGASAKSDSSANLIQGEP